MAIGELNAFKRRGKGQRSAILTTGLLLIILLAPLPLGSYRPFPWTVLAAAVAVLLLVWSARATFLRTRHVVTSEGLLPSLIGFSGVVLVALVQVLPFTPRDWHHPLWLEATAVVGDETQAAISADPYATDTALMRLLTYAGVFWLAFQLGQARHGSRRIMQTVAFAGFAYALYGLLVEPETLLWWRRWVPMRGITSTFVNENHYATYAGLGLLCALGLLITRTHRQYARARRHRHSRWVALRRITWRGWWLTATTACLALAVVSTTSRAGFASTAVALGVLIALLGMTRQMPKRAVQLGASGAIILGVAVLLLGGDDLTVRIAKTDLNTEGRFPMYGRIAAAILEAPWLGTGYGTFQTLFRAHQSISDPRHWSEAHNTYLENAFELGIPATLALVAAIGWIAWRCTLHVRQRRDNALYPCLGVAATVLVGLHALLDFSLELPAVAGTYAAVLGAAYSRTGDIKASSRPTSDRAAWRSPQHRPFLGIVALVGFVVMGLSVPRLAAEVTALPTTVVKPRLEMVPAPSVAQLDRAIAAGHAALGWHEDPDVWWRIGIAELHLAGRPRLRGTVRQAHLERAEHAFTQSLGRAPANPAAWLQLAYTVLAQGGNSARIDRALRLSVLTGPNHTGLMAVRTALAVHAWPMLSVSTRVLFRPQFAQTLRVAPQHFVELLDRSEHVDVVRVELKDQPALQARLDRLLLLLGRH